MSMVLGMIQKVRGGGGGGASGEGVCGGGRRVWSESARDAGKLKQVKVDVSRNGITLTR